jgi:hypothetical protein
VILAALLLLTPPAPAGSAMMPTEISALADGIRNEKSRLKRLELLSGLMADVRKRVSEVPENIDEAELPRIQALFELNILIGALKPETINPATCPGVLRTAEQMTKPVRDADVSETGRLALDVIKSVCAP